MLDTSDWLDYDTKLSAKEKLSNMNLKIGYPDYILDNSALDAEFDSVISCHLILNHSAIDFLAIQSD